MKQFNSLEEISCAIKIKLELDTILFSSGAVQQTWDVNPMSVIPNRLTAKLLNWNFHSFEAVFSWRDPQLQVSENYPV